MNVWTLLSSCAVVTTLFVTSVRADDVSQAMYDDNDAPLLKKVLKMLDTTLSIDATPWTVNLTTEELNKKTQLFHTDVTKLGQLLNLSTTSDWIAWDQKYTKAIQYNDKVTNDVSNADHVDDVVNIVDDLNDVIEVGPGIYLNTNKSGLCTKLNMIVDVAKSISEQTGGATDDRWRTSIAQLTDEINNKLPDPSYSKQTYDVIESFQEELKDLMDFGVPDWSKEPSSSELREKLFSFATAMNAVSNLTQLHTLNTWEPKVAHFNELTAKLTTTKSPELVTQLEQAAGAFTGLFNVDVNDWAAKPRAALSKDLADVERAVVDLNRALNRENDKKWTQVVTAMHHEVDVVPTTNISVVAPHVVKALENTDLIVSEKEHLTPDHRKGVKPDTPVPPYATNDDSKKLHIHLHVTHDRQLLESNVVGA